MVSKYYRYIFWTGYIAVLVMTFLPVSFRTEKIKFGLDAFTIRTDHLLHFGVYFLIMMYFLFGEIKGLTIFRENSLNKYILLILALATVTETAQLWVPARAFNVLDWVANAAGIVMGAVVCRLVIGRKMGVRG